MRESIDSPELTLRVQNLRKKMPGFVLEGEFELRASERLAVVGPSGIGKTTLLRLIAGLDAPDSGTIRLGDSDWSHVPVRERGVGFVFQEQALFSGRTVSENLAFGLEARSIPRTARDEQVAHWLDRFGLKDRARESVDHLSGGERQRVAIARALITRPCLLLLDEPFVGLDPELRESLIAELVRLHAENPVPLLFVSHEEQDARKLATGRLEIVESVEKDGSKIRRIRRAAY